MYALVIALSCVTIGWHWYTIQRWKREAEKKAEDKGFKKGYQMGMAYGRETAEFWKEEK